MRNGLLALSVLSLVPGWFLLAQDTPAPAAPVASAVPPLVPPLPMTPLVPEVDFVGPLLEMAGPPLPPDWQKTDGAAREPEAPTLPPEAPLTPQKAPPPPVWGLPTEPERPRPKGQLGGGLFSPDLYPLTQPSAEVGAFGLAASIRIVDPAHALPAALVPAVQAFLHEQSGQGRFPLAIRVMDSTSAPDAAELEAWRKAVFPTQEQGVLALWSPTVPALRRLVVSASVRSRYASTALEALLRRPIEALTRLEAEVEPLAGFLIQSALTLNDIETLPAATREPVFASVPQTAPAVAAPGARIGSKPVAVVRQAPASGGGWAWWIGLVASGVSGWFLWRRFRPAPASLHFPECDSFPRLHAPHSGGTGGVVSWE
jgi:hypothetical protein